MVAKLSSLLAAALLVACSDPYGVSSADPARPPVVSFRVEVVEGASAEDVAMVEQAAAAWSAVASDQISLTVETRAAVHPPEDGEIVVQFRPSGLSTPEGYYLGDCSWGSIPGTPSTWASMWVADDLDSDVKWLTVVHEMGHSLGLDHSAGPAPSAMKSWFPQAREPTCADAAELCRLWGCYPACSAPGF